MMSLVSSLPSEALIDLLLSGSLSVMILSNVSSESSGLKLRKTSYRYTKFVGLCYENFFCEFFCCISSICPIGTSNFLPLDDLFYGETKT